MSGFAEHLDSVLTLREEREHEKVFFDLLRGRNYEALGNSERSLVKAKKGIGWRVPARLRRMILPQLTFGNALLSQSDDGQKLIDPTFLSGISRFAAESNALFPRTTRVPAPSGAIRWPKLKQSAPGAEGTADEFAEFGFANVEWRSDGSEAHQSDPEFDSQFSIKTQCLSALVWASSHLANATYTKLEDLLQTIFRAAMLSKIDSALIGGNGSSFVGILQTTGVTAVNRVTPNQVNHDDLIDLMFSVPDAVRAECVWSLSGSAHKHLMKKKDSQNRPLYPDAKELLGFPVVVSPRQPALGTAGDVTFGPWNQYICAVEEEFTIGRTDHQRFSEGLVGFLVEMYVGGKLPQPQTFAKLN